MRSAMKRLKKVKKKYAKELEGDFFQAHLLHLEAELSKGPSNHDYAIFENKTVCIRV